MATLLFRDTFAETANLPDHTPTPSGGPAWEVNDPDADAYTSHVGSLGGSPAGYLDGAIAAATGPARNAFLIPVGVKRWRKAIDVFRGGVDAVGGGFTFYTYAAAGPIGTWDAKNTVAWGVARRDADKVQFSVVYARPTLPAGPTTVDILSASVFMGPNEWRRFIVEVDETLGTGQLFLADAFTGANELTMAEAFTAGDLEDPATGPGTLPAELLDHIANDPEDRLLGLQGGWSASGQVYFAARDLQFLWIETLPTGNPCSQIVTVFGIDSITPLWEVGTDPAHENPYLEDGQDYLEQEIDIAKGAATLGTIRARIIDKAMVPGDQDGGWMTDKLADAGGVPAIGGLRARWIRFDPDGTPIVVIDGPAGQPAMLDYAGFDFEIRDWRERERDLPLFDTILPAIDLSTDEADTTPTSGGTDSAINWNTEYHAP
jgi:hypothetical protein